MTGTNRRTKDGYDPDVLGVPSLSNVNFFVTIAAVYFGLGGYVATFGGWSSVIGFTSVLAGFVFLRFANREFRNYKALKTDQPEPIIGGCPRPSPSIEAASKPRSWIGRARQRSGSAGTTS